MGTKVEKSFDSPFLWHNLEKDHLHLLAMPFPTSREVGLGDPWASLRTQDFL